MCKCPARCLDCIAERGGKRVLGRESIVDAEHAMSAAIGDGAAHVLVRFEIAKDPTAAVQIHEQPEIHLGARAIQPGRYPAGVEIADLVNEFGGRRAPGVAGVSCLLWRTGLDGGHADRVGKREQRLCLWVQRHCSRFLGRWCRRRRGIGGGRGVATLGRYGSGIDFFLWWRDAD